MVLLCLILGLGGALTMADPSPWSNPSHCRRSRCTHRDPSPQLRRGEVVRFASLARYVDSVTEYLVAASSRRAVSAAHRASAPRAVSTTCDALRSGTTPLLRTVLHSRASSDVRSALTAHSILRARA